MTFPIRCHGIRRCIARILAVARVETLQLISDRTTLSLILLVPVQIVLFGYAVNLDPRHIPIVIARDHQGPEDQVDRVIGKTGYFKVLADGLKPGAAERMVTQGKALVGIELSARDDDAPRRSGQR
jgi:ABC-2 type transport system permease protein